MRSTAPVAWVGLVAAIATASYGIGFATGCGRGEDANLVASQVGAVALIPVPKLRFDARATAECGHAELTSAGERELARAPYLQHSTSTSTSLLWTTGSDERYRVDLALPDGSERRSFASHVDSSARPTDAQQHLVELRDLEPNQTYCYSLISADGTPLTQRSSFRTAPEVGADVPVSFVAFGDSGDGGGPQLEVGKHMQDVAFDLVLVTGDLAYESGTRVELEQEFFEVYAPMLGAVPAFPVLGNHDNYTEQAGPFREAFVLPENGGPEGREYWYSFDWGPVHFVALDTERTSKTQADWLEADLSATTQPWTIVYTHKSPYSAGEHGSNLAFRETFGAILTKHQVPLVLAGHDHDYERTKPIGSTTYVVTGGGGRSSRPVGREAFTAFSEDVLHFVHVTIDGPDLHLHAIDGTGAEFDYLHLTKS